MTEQIKSGKIAPGMTFNEKVWALTRRIPRGKVVTYGDIARKLNTTGYRTEITEEISSQGDR